MELLGVATSDMPSTYCHHYLCHHQKLMHICNLSKTLGNGNESYEIQPREISQAHKMKLKTKV